ncbi:MAG: hypothetical protein JRJ40_01300 [Deltaproteobacteria bacterium]|nr:hypothetical protein [Deltaproteobacteria bacterium]
MRILTSWLKEFVHFTVPVETLAEDLTMAGLEVEEIEPAYKGLVAFAGLHGNRRRTEM